MVRPWKQFLSFSGHVICPYDNHGRPAWPMEGLDAGDPKFQSYVDHPVKSRASRTQSQPFE